MLSKECEPSRIWTPIDFERDGKQIDCLRLPISTDDSAYGWIPIPLACLRNGPGPTAVLVAGSHGDEYEGELALLKLIRALDASAISGRIIVLPAFNYPAVKAGRRVSPIDEGNLNRVYPGRAHGTATQMLAHYMVNVLLPLADIVIDLHSGGRSLEYLPCSLIRPGRNRAERDGLLDLVRIFGAPIGYVTDGTGGGGNTTLPVAAERQDVPVLTTELGGGAGLSSAGLALAEQGVRRILQHLGILSDATIPGAGPTRVMAVPSRDYFVYAETEGLFEPSVELGDEVVAGQIAGYLHSIDFPGHDPQAIAFSASGLVACRRFPALARRGDCLFGLMRDISVDDPA